MSNEMIERNPEILGGTPCIAGTRMNVYALEARVKGGETLEDIVADYSGYITADQVRAAVAYAAANPQVEHPDSRPWRKKAKQTAA